MGLLTAGIYLGISILISNMIIANLDKLHNIPMYDIIEPKIGPYLENRSAIILVIMILLMNFLMVLNLNNMLLMQFRKDKVFLNIY